MLKYQTTILEKINGKPRPPFPPKSKSGKRHGFFHFNGFIFYFLFFFGGGGNGGLLFHFILSKIVGPASRRGWSLMYEGKLIKRDTSLKKQTNTIKNLHGWPIGCESCSFLSGFWTFILLTSYLALSAIFWLRSAMISSCPVCISFRSGLKRKFSNTDISNWFNRLHKFCLISTLALFIKFCDDTCPFISEHLLWFYSLVTLPTDPHLQTLFTKCTWLIKVKFRLNLFTWIDSWFKTFLS